METTGTELSFQVVIAIPDAHWRKFETWADKPAKAIPALAQLAWTQPA